MRLLERYSTIVFDLHGVLMFDHDRFGPEQDYALAYRAHGGSRLARSDLHAAVHGCLEGLSADARRPERFDDFPSLEEGLRAYGRVPEEELALLSLVFALHECGRIPDGCASLIARLGRSHRLGLLSNIWSPKYFWQRELERVGVEHAFHLTLFSSDGRSIKPSSKLFREALRGVGAEPEQALFVGDSLQHDIEGAKRVGMRTVWVNREHARSDAADYVIETVHDLEHLAA